MSNYLLNLARKGILPVENLRVGRSILISYSRKSACRAIALETEGQAAKNFNLDNKKTFGSLRLCGFARDQIFSSLQDLLALEPDL